MKFKWRVIQKLMETKGPQVMLLLSNLKFFIAEVKKESKHIQYNEEGSIKFVRKCRGCRKKINIKTKRPVGNSSMSTSIGGEDAYCSADELFSDDEKEKSN